MKKYSAAILVVCVFFAGASYAAFDDNDQGRMKFSFDSLPLFGDSAKDRDCGARQVPDDHEDDEYTYDVTGRKVPVRTLRSGDASPVH
jgi:hypothetical protein